MSAENRIQLRRLLRELDEVKHAPAQERSRQRLLFVVRDEDDRPQIRPVGRCAKMNVWRFSYFELEPVELAEEIIWEVDVCLVYLLDEHYGASAVACANYRATERTEADVAANLG